PHPPLPAPSPYVEQTDSFIERREPESRPSSPVRAVRTGHRVPHPRPPLEPGTHVMALFPSSVPLRVPLLPPLASSLLAVAMLIAPKGDPDAPDIPAPRSNVEAIMGPYSSEWQTAMDADMAS
ncbi:unnamed protein product, partial [Closterium sp. NIES-54]